MTIERIVAGLVDKVERRFHGKYRGFVVDNEDPALLGRLKVTVPSVLGPHVVTGWATPCVPYGGKADQGFAFIPDREAGVWVEFEEGDLEFPIWVGTWWAKPDAETQFPKPLAVDGTAGDVANPLTRRILRTTKGHTIQFDDTDDAESVLVRDGVHGHLITLDKTGVTIVDATGNKIEMTDSALTITAKVPFTLDASGQPVVIIGDSIDLKKG